MSELDQQAYLLEADYSALGEVTAAEAARAKGALCSAADGVYALLRSLERTPEYKKALKDSK